MQEGFQLVCLHGAVVQYCCWTCVFFTESCRVCNHWTACNVRMDIILFIKGFDCLDLGIYMCALLSSLQVLFTGHNMYSKFILLEDLLNNPVMHVFLGLVSKKIKVW